MVMADESSWSSTSYRFGGWRARPRRGNGGGGRGDRAHVLTSGNDGRRWPESEEVAGAPAVHAASVSLQWTGNGGGTIRCCYAS